MKRVFDVVCVLLSLSLLTVCTFAQNGTANQADRLEGRIVGTVLTSEGTPVADAVVYLFRRSRSPVTTTDPSGEFTFSNLPVGTHKVIAYKESDGFPNTLWSFYSETYEGKGIQLVRIDGNQAETKVIIKLGPKAGRLLLHIIDSQSRQPIMDAVAEMDLKGRPKTLFRSRSVKPDGFDLLIPPNLPVEVTITAPGYQTWHYQEGGLDFIRLNSGAERTMTVELNH